MKKRIISVILIISLLTMMLAGCTQASKVSSNISQEADNFNVVRRLVVVNGRTDKPFFEMVGAFSYELDVTDGIRRIICIVEVGDGIYKKHSVGLPDEAFWDVEDLSGAEVNKYKYEVNYLPEMIVPITFTNND